MEIINFTQGEKKIIKFIIKDKKTKFPISLTGCTFALKLKDSDSELDKADSDFDKSDVTLGIIKVTLDTALTTIGKYDCQLQINFLNGEIDKSSIFNITVSEGII